MAENTRSSYIKEMQFYSLFSLFQKSWWKGQGIEVEFLQRGKRMAYDLFATGMTAKGHKIVGKLSFTISGDSPRIREEICMARDALCHTSLAW